MTRYVVTGAAGFVGANLVRALNARGCTDVIAVDDLTHGDRFVNLSDCTITDYLDRDEFLVAIEQKKFGRGIKAVLHQGACSDTTERNGRYMMETNYRYSRTLFQFCAGARIPLLYASSASVYGSGRVFAEGPEHERPLNIYGYSKWLFDQYVRRHAKKTGAQVVGLRYFNVYGPREQHKGRMASVAFHFCNQYRTTGSVKLFEGSGGYGNGEQRRDFISIDDVVKVNLYFLEHPRKSGIFNCGTGAAQSFNDVAVAAVNACRAAQGAPELSLREMQDGGVIQYIPFPADLQGRYQSFTQADMTQLRSAGYRDRFASVETGVRRYVSELVQSAV